MQKETKNITLTENYIWKGQYGTFLYFVTLEPRLKWPNEPHGAALKLEAPVLPTRLVCWLLAPSTGTFGMSTQGWETPTPRARVNCFLPITRNNGKSIMLCTHSYIMFNKLHDKKHLYKPVPLITTYLLNPEQPSPFGTIWALITSTWWPKKSLHDT